MSLKILTVCRHGNVRSVALAYLMKTIYKHDAIACGIKDTHLETFKMLYQWADKVIILDSKLYGDFIKKIGMSEETLGSKTCILDVGEDVWFDPYHHSLQHKLLKQIHGLGL